jgi:type II secretory pathway pseudopilin PulG
MIIKEKGFTLIELIVIIGMSAMVMVTVGGILTSSYRAKNTSDRTDLIQQQSTFLTEQIKKNILEAIPDQIVCPVGTGTSISFTTKKGGMTRISCDDTTGQVASFSAMGVGYSLLSNNVVARNCDEFVTCELLPSLEVSSVNFKMNLGTSILGSETNTIEFMTRITPRD